MTVATFRKAPVGPVTLCYSTSRSGGSDKSIRDVADRIGAFRAAFVNYGNLAEPKLDAIAAACPFDPPFRSEFADWEFASPATACLHWARIASLPLPRSVGPGGERICMGVGTFVPDMSEREKQAVAVVWGQLGLNVCVDLYPSRAFVEASDFSGYGAWAKARIGSVCRCHSYAWPFQSGLRVPTFSFAVGLRDRPSSPAKDGEDVHYASRSLTATWIKAQVDAIRASRELLQPPRFSGVVVWGHSFSPEVVVEDARSLRVIADELGVLGKGVGGS